jgi:hypothetical protein
VAAEADIGLAGLAGAVAQPCIGLKLSADPAIMQQYSVGIDQ